MKKGISIALTVILVFVSVYAVLLPIEFNYSEAHHIRRVERRIEKRYFGDISNYYQGETSIVNDFFEQFDGEYLENNRFESYELHPVYDINDELKYFVVDLNPTGYMYIRINKGGLLFDLNGVRYTRSGYVPKWARATLERDEETNELEYAYETDENGEIIYHTSSHYKVAEVENERLYLLYIRNGYIPAVKRGDKFLNLVSMEEYDYTQECPEEAYVLAPIGVSYPKPELKL